ncbi:MAG: hypothetical protein GTN93_17930, partial [Anaerolineae bacterium]|nr:hypothetical protein [Anaerolineae bacterium]NIQ79925.1 hypothetical protein [Anaerolineae bacterium]
ADLIAEVSELFEGPRLFHLGMDEETLEHHRGLRLEHVVIRQGQAWLDALLKLDGFVRANGARSWIWADPLWPGRSTENAKVPKRIMLSDWHYHVADDYPSMRRLDQL